MSILLQFAPTFFFYSDTAPTEIYTLSLHDALPISSGAELARRYEGRLEVVEGRFGDMGRILGGRKVADRKSTRLNSSHSQISYAVFCLKKKIGGGRARNVLQDWCAVYVIDEHLTSVRSHFFFL